MGMAAPDGDLDTYEDDGHDDGGKITENVDEPGEENKNGGTSKGSDTPSNANNVSPPPPPENWVDHLADGVEEKKEALEKAENDFAKGASETQQAEALSTPASQIVQVQSRVEGYNWAPSREQLKAMKMAEVRARGRFDGVSESTDPAAGGVVFDAQVHVLTDPSNSALAAVDAGVAVDDAVVQQRQRLTRQVSHISAELGLTNEAAPQPGSSMAPLGPPKKEVTPTAPMPQPHPTKKAKGGVRLVPVTVKGTTTPSPPPLVLSRPPAKAPIRQALMPPQPKPKASGA